MDQKTNFEMVVGTEFKQGHRKLKYEDNVFLLKEKEGSRVDQTTKQRIVLGYRLCMVCNWLSPDYGESMPRWPAIRTLEDYHQLVDTGLTMTYSFLKIT